MKKIILSIFSLITLSVVVKAQKVGVGVERSEVGESSILEFPDTATKGILLPKIENKTTAGTTSGTFIFDNSSKKVAFYGKDGWVEMTENGGSDNIPNTLYNNKEELNAEGVVIEDGTSNGDIPVGVLTLESNKRALVLPTVEDVTKELPNPLAGTICYDKKSSSLAVFNGTEWTFWR